MIETVTYDSTPVSGAVLDSFHPAVRSWFARRFPAGPTAPQAASWPVIAGGGDVLVASPTGTGKTLTGFLVAIDAAYRAHAAGLEPTPGPAVVYVSPLRALAVDVHENLQVPLREIADEAARLGMSAPEITVAVRTGDTPANERAAMRRHPPHLLVTTPESLYLLLTAASTRGSLAHARTVIVDEIHALAKDKRGAHLALTLERFTHVVQDAGGSLQRIGLSATQRPLELVGQLLSGVGPGRAAPSIVDCGLLRRLDVEIELPNAELDAVTSHEQFGRVLDRLTELIHEHRSTLIFVNTRKMAERVAHLLSDRLDPEGNDASLAVSAHHGSLSASRRKLIENRLRAGDLRALVATSSLELGIDVGPIDLACQLGSPRAISTFIQRVGRANHHLEGVPRGRLFPMTRDELVECTALLGAVRAGRLDRLFTPLASLDVLAQQVIAEVASEEWAEADLYDCLRHAAPYADLSEQDYEQVIDLVSWGIQTGRGRRGAFVHRDGVNGQLRARKGARIAALTGGGAIPETGDYKVVLDPEGVTVGSVHEDFAIEATGGDVFLLGTHSWRVRRVEVDTVRVEDAGNTPPSMPFWLGEAPARTAELSDEVSFLRGMINEALAASDLIRARREVAEWAGVSDACADQVVEYMAATRAALGTLPTRNELVVERCFDESEGTQIIVHSPYGGRVNRALGLALRKRFCVSFDFELQAAADDDAVLLSLGPQHSFALSDVAKMVRSTNAVETLTQAVLQHPMLQARWRWNCNRALVVARFRNGAKRPIHLQRMDAADVMAATWPQLAACQDNAVPGPIPVPEHALARQSVRDCLEEALDAEGLVALLREIEAERVVVRTVESAEPSPLAHAILNGRPYTFLDGAPLEERRSRALSLRRGLDSAHHGLGVAPRDLAPLDEGSAAEVIEQVQPPVRSADELHDLLLTLVLVRPLEQFDSFYGELAADRRVIDIDGCWAAVERRDLAASLSTDDAAAAECLRGHLELAGPIDLDTLTGEGVLPGALIRGAPITRLRAATAMARLEQEGTAISLEDERWCARHLLVRLHNASRRTRRARVEASSITDYVRFLTRWQHVALGTRLEGRQGVLEVIEQLQGIEVAAAEWESSILPARVEHYDPRWLDELCLGGEIGWARLTPRIERVGDGERRGVATPLSTTPLALVLREDLELMLAAVRLGEPAPEPTAGAAHDLLTVLEQRGACFRSDLRVHSGRLPTEVDEGLWDLVARGLVTADAFSAVRSLLKLRHYTRSTPTHRGMRVRPLARRLSEIGSGQGEGRWSLLPGLKGPDETASWHEDDMADAIAGQLISRWGIVGWEIWARESYRLPWRNVVRALRRLEARGLCLGGRFVAGISGEQYADPQAVEMLATTRSSGEQGEEVRLSAADPLNVTGYLLPGPRVPSVRHRTVVLRDGNRTDDEIVVPFAGGIAARASRSR